MIRFQPLLALASVALSACTAVSQIPGPPATSTPARSPAASGRGEPPSVSAALPAEPTPARPTSLPPSAASQPAAPGETPAWQPPPDTGTLIVQWQDDLRGLSPEALQREVARGVDPGNRVHDGIGPSGQNMRWALALLQTRGSAELTKAQAALEQVSRSSQAEAQAWRPWARLLLARVQDQRRLDEQIDRQAQQIRDQQRRIDGLQDKLEALKAIERSLVPRPPAPPAPAARPKSP